MVYSVSLTALGALSSALPAATCIPADLNKLSFFFLFSFTAGGAEFFYVSLAAFFVVVVFLLWSRAATFPSPHVSSQKLNLADSQEVPRTTSMWPSPRLRLTRDKVRSRLQARGTFSPASRRKSAARRRPAPILSAHAGLGARMRPRLLVFNTLLTKVTLIFKLIWSRHENNRKRERSEPMSHLQDFALWHYGAKNNPKSRHRNHALILIFITFLIESFFASSVLNDSHPTCWFFRFLRESFDAVFLLLLLKRLNCLLICFDFWLNKCVEWHLWLQFFFFCLFMELVKVEGCLNGNNVSF